MIRDMLGLIPTEGEIGFEIEVEGERLPRRGRLLDHWRVERDGSLKTEDAAEYVLRNPSSLKQLKKALDCLDASFETNHAIFYESFRAGVHCHINCQELTIRQVINFAVSYYVLEELLVDWCGPDRVGNHFCLRAIDAEAVISAMCNCIHNSDLSYLSGDSYRYAALNFVSLFKYGSLEFRSMESCRDFKRLYKWAKILLHIRDVSLNYSNPQEIINSFSADGLRTFVIRFLGDYSKEFTSIPNYEEKVQRGMRIAQEIAYCHNWDSQEDTAFIWRGKSW